MPQSFPHKALTLELTESQDADHKINVNTVTCIHIDTYRSTDMNADALPKGRNLRLSDAVPCTGAFAEGLDADWQLGERMLGLGI